MDSLTTHRFGTRMMAIAVTLVVCVHPVQAQLSEIDRIDVASELRSLSDSLSAEALPNLSVAKQEVVHARDALNQYLSTHTSSENWAAWLKYVDLDPLIGAIDSGQEDPRDLAAMGREAIDAQQRLIGLAPGLELQPLRNLRQSIANLISALRYHDDERFLAVIGKQMTALADRIETLEGVPSPNDEAAITALVGTLQDSGQARTTASRLRGLFGKPNIEVWVSESVVQQAVNRGVDEQTPVNDCILGTRIAGQARLTGVVTADLLPSIGAVRMRVQMTGCVNSINKGYNGPVVLRTSGIGEVHASRELTFNESGIQLQPATANVSLRTEVNAIEHRLRIVRKIARKRAAEQKPKADVIAKQKFYNRVREEFTKQTDETANVPTPDVMEKARPVLQRLDLTEPTRFWGSTDNALYVNSTFRRDDQISSAISAPPLAQNFDAAVQVHESVVNNAVAPIFAGRTLNEAKLDELMERAGRMMPEQSTGGGEEEDDDEQPFEIDFSRIRPIIFEARDQRVRIGVRGTRFAQGPRELKRPMEITAVYAPATMQDGRMVLVREGEVDVDFPGGRRLTISQAGLKGTIKKKFADVFPELLLDQPLQVPDTVKVDSLRGRVYHPCMIAAENGWLSLAVR